MASSTVPTPLYPIYQARDGFSTLVITVIFGAYAVGVLLALFLIGHISDWFGRRRALVAAVLASVVSAGVFVVWRDLPGLLLGRVISGVSVGVVTATATAYLAELCQSLDASPRRAQVLATTANLGGLGLGAFVAGLLAQAVAAPLTVPFVLFGALLLVATFGVALAPETVTPLATRPRYRPQRIAVPAEARGRFFGAAAGGFVSFAALGLFTSLAPSLLVGTLGHRSHALAGVPALTAFTGAVAAQLAAGDTRPDRLVRLGAIVLSTGIALVASAAWLASLFVFLAAGAITGVGAGLLFMGGIVTVSRLATPERRAEVLAGFFLASYVGISVPVLGLGALSEVIQPKVALLAFAGVLLVGIALADRSRACPRLHAQPAPD
jgi:dipeptide/tripeptide permease